MSPRKKLLLADDSITIQRVIELTFSGEDIQVIAVGDGEEAILRIAEEHPDIVLADIAMPKRSGYDVAAFVKGRPDLAHIPVLLLAGAFEPVDEARAQQAGSNGVLVKPFEPQNVIARVRELVGGAQGSPMSSAAADIPRPVARLASPKPVELPRREKAPEPINVQDYDYTPAPTNRPSPPVAPPRPQATSQVVDDGPADEEASLDDYFDRLDAAFADLDQPGYRPAQAGARKVRPRTEGPVMERDLEYIDPLPAVTQPEPFELPDDPLEADAAPAVEVAEIPTLEELLGEVGEDADLGDVFSIDEPLGAVDAVAEMPLQAPERVAPAVLAAPEAVVEVPVPVAVEPLVPVVPLPAPVPVAAPPAPAVSRATQTIADAFSALLAVEQGEPGAPPGVRLVTEPSAPVITDELVSRVADQVLERLRTQSGGTVDELVARVVSEIAERRVREEIERIRNK